jgi:hypothetical protein
MALSPLERRSNESAWARGGHTIRANFFKYSADLVYGPVFLLLESPLLCLDARGLQGNSHVCHYSHLWSASAC